jgi:hypothetical protein
MDLERLQALLKGTFFGLAHAEFAHVCIHRLHGNNLASQGIALTERRKGPFDMRLLSRIASRQ